MYDYRSLLGEQVRVSPSLASSEETGGRQSSDSTVEELPIQFVEGNNSDESRLIPYPRAKIQPEKPIPVGPDKELLFNGLEEGSFIEPLDLHRAVKLGVESIVKKLIQKNYDVGARDENGNTPLHLAANRGYVKIAETLIKHGADVDAANSIGRRPLHFAAQSQKEGVVDLLLDSGAGKNVEDEPGFKPVFLALLSGDSILSKKLMVPYASFDTPLDKAQQKALEMQGMLKEIKEKTVQRSQPSNLSWTSTLEQESSNQGPSLR